MTNRIAIAVHGGAGDFPDSLVSERQAGIREALKVGWAILERGGSALDASERAVVQLEDMVVFNAGIGAKLNCEGAVELDAAIMEGSKLDAGAVAAVKRIRNPVSLARRVMERSEHVFLVADGAEQFAVSHGIALTLPGDLVAPGERARWSDWKQKEPDQRLTGGGTVGAVAIDKDSCLAAATSTGGTFAKHPGRVGDSPILGCGCYADNELGAVSATGDGEQILRVGLSRIALERVRNGDDPQRAVEKALGQMDERTKGKGGLILVDGAGRIGIAYTTPRMSAGYCSSGSGGFQLLEMNRRR